MQNRQFLQQLFAVKGEFDQHLAAVMIAVPANHGTMFDQAVDQLHGAVMTQAEPRRQHGYGGTHPFGQTLDGQHQLVLLRLNATQPSSFFAEMQELTNLVAEFGKLLKCGGREAWCGC